MSIAQDIHLVSNVILTDIKEEYVDGRVYYTRSLTILHDGQSITTTLFSPDKNSLNITTAE